MSTNRALAGGGAILIAVAAIAVVLVTRPPTAAVSGASPTSGTPAVPTPAATPIIVATPFASPTARPTDTPRPTLANLAYTQSHSSTLYRYAAKYPSTWTLSPGVNPNSVDTVPDLSLGESDFYGDGVNSGVMVTSAPASKDRPDLASWSAFVTRTVEGQYGNYIGIANCYEPTRTLVVDGEPANEIDFVCPGRDWLWVSMVHAGRAYQVAWLDDGGFDSTYLRPFLDQFLAGFSFTK